MENNDLNRDTPGHDPRLEAALRDAMAGAGPLPDDGFTARVLAALPPARGAGAGAGARAASPWSWWAALPGGEKVAYAAAVGFTGVVLALSGWEAVLAGVRTLNQVSVLLTLGLAAGTVVLVRDLADGDAA